jgi:hypothetical protein
VEKSGYFVILAAMCNPLSVTAQAVWQAIIAYKKSHDGISPAMQDLANLAGCSKTRSWHAIGELEAAGLLQRLGGGRGLMVHGGQWRWARPQPYPAGRLGDVLRVVVAYKAAHDGLAPKHREIAAALGLAYTGAIKGYLDQLAAQGYVSTGYATDRGIAVTGGEWRWQEPGESGAAAAILNLEKGLTKWRREVIRHYRK